jgi:hypothetical protein
MTCPRRSILPAVILAAIVALAAAAPAQGQQATAKPAESNFLPCSACHDPAFSGGDKLPKSGVGHGTRLDLVRIQPLVRNGHAPDREAQPTKARCAACHQI